jgi:O-antigen ligase
MLGLLAYESTLVRGGIPMLLNFFVLLGIQVRAEWLAFAASFTMWSGLTGRVAQVVKFGLAATLLLVVGLIADFKLPAPSTRGGEISVRGVVGRSLSSVSPQLAGRFLDDPERYASTVSWRTGWWKAIIRKSHEHAATAIFGLGYGFPIWDYHPEGVAEGLRTPHSITVYTLGYTGWLGLGFFLLLQLSLAYVLWRTFRETGEPFGLMCLALFNLWACADNLLEAPYGAIPLYLLLGLSAAALIRKRNGQKDNGRPAQEGSP